MSFKIKSEPFQAFTLFAAVALKSRLKKQACCPAKNISIIFVVTDMVCQNPVKQADNSGQANLEEMIFALGKTVL